MIKKILDIRFDQQFIKPHIQRIKQDAGAWRNETATKQFQKLCKDYNMLDSIRFAWLGEAGGKLRTSGANQFWTKAYSLVVPQPVQARRNLLTYTEEFDNAAWTKSSTTVTTNLDIDPLNKNTADAINETTSIYDHTISKGAVGLPVNTYTYSVYLKSKERSYAVLYLFSGSGTVKGVLFNLNSGEFISHSDSNNTVSSYSSENIGNGWYRFSITASSTLTELGVTISNSSTPTLSATKLPVYTGDGTSGIYIWGAQLEVGSSASAYQRVIDANSWDGVMTDATQTTSTSQPYLSGNIAPNEKWCLKNPNGGDEYMTHPTISFAANEAWSVTTVITPYGSNAGVNSRILGNDTASKTRIELAPNGGTLYVYGETANGSIAIPNRKGKRTILHVTYNGAGVVSVSINATAIGTININDSFIFNTLNRASGGQYFFGENSGVVIRAGELTLSQKQAEANFLRSLYPEIPSVTIGSQVWATSNCEMVATPMGNVIPEVQLASQVERVINNTFETADNIIFGSWTHDSVNQRLVKSSSSVDYGSLLTYSNSYSSGKYYKLTFTLVNRVSGGIVFRLGHDGTWSPSYSTDGTHTVYIKTNGLQADKVIYFGGSYVGGLDDVYLKELGWADRTELYDARIAKGVSVANATKECAAWCYYNNDAALGAVYGKLLNDYAIKLLDMDIAYYNTANPTTPWGWGISTEADWNALETTVNNDAEALKHAGTTYWTAPNVGTNSSGFTALPAGYRKEDGTFGGLNTTALFGSTDMSVPRIGKSLRLIKR